MKTTTKQIRTEINPFNLSDFLDTERLLEELQMNSRIKFNEADIVKIENHRAAYGCPAYQIWEVTKIGEMVLRQLER